MQSLSHTRGVTMLELMTVISIGGILLSLAIPSYFDFIERKRLKSATELVYNDLKYAHSESIKRQGTLFITYQTGPNWCYGIDDAGECDCSVANDCQIDGVEKVERAVDYPGTSLTVNGLTAGASNPFASFEGIRGVVDTVGSVTLTRATGTARVDVDKLGLIQHCSNTLKGYPACP